MVRHGGSGIEKLSGKGAIDVQALLPVVSPLVKVTLVSEQILLIAKRTIDWLVTTLMLFSILRQTSVCVELGEEKQVPLNSALITAVYTTANIIIL